MPDEKRALITPEVFPDLPLDAEGQEDEAFFRFEDYANTFARLIADQNTRTPLVISISGEWGVGKTTLLNLLRAKLDETEKLRKRRNDPTDVSFLRTGDNKADFRRCRTVWFNAWKYADEDSLLAALIRNILAEMARGDFRDKVTSLLLDQDVARRDVLATFLSAFQVKFGDIGFGLDMDKYKTETPVALNTSFFDRFNDIFDELVVEWVHHKLDVEKIDEKQSVLVVFIDDLDRCLPEKTVQVLEAVKLFLDKRGVVFVIGASENLVSAAVAAHYQNQKITGLRARDYLEKIFQIRFSLPPLASIQMEDYLTKLGLDKQLRSNVDLIIAGAETNPRQIKTFVNYLNVSWAELVNSGQAEAVSRADFTRWLALTRVAPDFCDHVRERITKELRLKFITDATRWAGGLDTDGFEEGDENARIVRLFLDWRANLRLRRVLQQTAFSVEVDDDALERFIFWSAPADAIATPRREAVKDAKSIERAPESRASEAGEWLRIPAGEFVMGSSSENELSRENEQPQHTVDIPYDYRIARTPVTNQEFAQFLEATHYDMDTEIVKKDVPDHPVVNVIREDAGAYCEWLTSKLHQSSDLESEWTVRLPSEAEWEKAARGEYGNEWPWGNGWDSNKCNSKEGGVGDTTPVGQYSPDGDSPYGAADMVGNVWEWTNSLYKPYPYKRDDGREVDSGAGRRVLRGGSFQKHSRFARAAFRFNSRPDYRSDHRGFRVCASPRNSDL